MFQSDAFDASAFFTGGSVGGAPTLGVGFGSSYAFEVLSDQPTGYWRMSESSGNALDISGNGLHATNVGTMSRSVPGVVIGNTAAQIDATDGLFYAPDVALTRAVIAWTAEAWIYPTAYPTSAGAGYIFYKDKIQLRIDPAYEGNGISAFVGIGGVYEPRATHATAPPLRRWTHVAATFDGTTLLLYVNGVLAASQTRSGVVDSSAGTVLYMPYNDPNNRFLGRIDEVAYWNNISVPSARIAAHYAAAMGRGYASEVMRDGPLGYWKLDEPAGPTAFDSSGSNYHAVINGSKMGVAGVLADGTTGAEFWQGGAQGSDYISVGNQSAFNLAGVSPFAVVGCINIASLQAAYYPRFIGKESFTLAGGRAGWTCYTTPSGFSYSGIIGFDRYNAGAFAGGNSSDVPLTIGASGLIHFVWTWDGTSTYADLYINGVQQFVRRSAISSMQAATDVPLVIGADTAGYSNWRGKGDEFAIYDHFLPASRVAALYAAISQVPTNERSWKHAIAGDTLAGSARTAYYDGYPNRLIVDVGGTNIRDKVWKGTIALNDASGQDAATGNFMTHSGYKSPVGAEVVIAIGTVGGGRLFGGRVQSVEDLARYQNHYQTNIVDWRADFDRDRVFGRWTGMAADEVLRDIIKNYCYGFSANHVYVGAPSIPEVNATGEAPSALAQQIADYLGWVFKIDPYKDAWLQPRGNFRAAPIMPGVHTFENLRWKESWSQVRTRVYGIGGGGSVASDYNFSGSGTAVVPMDAVHWYRVDQFVLWRERIARVTAIDTALKTLTLSPWYSQPIGDADSGPLSGEATAFKQGDAINIFVIRDNAAGIARMKAIMSTPTSPHNGIIVHVVTDGTRNEDGIIALADANLARFALPAVSGGYDTWGDVQAGQLVAVDYPKRGLRQDVVVQSVSTRLTMAPDAIARSVSFSDTQELRFIDLIRSQARKRKDR